MARIVSVLELAEECGLRFGCSEEYLAAAVNGQLSVTESYTIEVSLQGHAAPPATRMLDLRPRFPTKSGDIRSLHVQHSILGGPFGPIRFYDALNSAGGQRVFGARCSPDMIVQNTFADAVRIGIGVIDPSGRQRVLGRSAGCLLAVASLYRQPKWAWHSTHSTELCAAVASFAERTQVRPGRSS